MQSELNIKFKKLHPNAKCPTKSNFEDAGWDLYAIEDTVFRFGKTIKDKWYIEPGKILKVRTGLAVNIPKGYVGLIWDRSGLSIKHGIHRLGGVIDASYRGEIMVGLTNLKYNFDSNMEYDGSGIPSLSGTYCISKGDRIAQLLIQEIPLYVTWEEVEELEETNRGTDGFGSTGF